MFKFEILHWHLPRKTEDKPQSCTEWSASRRDSNRLPHECKSETLRLEPTVSVGCILATSSPFVSQIMAIRSPIVRKWTKHSYHPELLSFPLLVHNLPLSQLCSLLPWTWWQCIPPKIGTRPPDYRMSRHWPQYSCWWTCYSPFGGHGKSCPFSMIMTKIKHISVTVMLAGTVLRQVQKYFNSIWVSHPPTVG
jgi:hypothetical protein